MRLKRKVSDQCCAEESAVKMEVHMDVGEDVATVRKRRINQKAQKGLLEALRNNDVPTFTALLKEDVDVDHDYVNHTLLMEACCRAGGEKFVETLLRAGASPNKADADGQTALHGAAWEKNDKCMQLLLDDPRTIANVLNDQQYTPLHCATLAFWDHTSAAAHSHCIQMLMCRPDLEVNRPDKFGDSAVWNALHHPDSDAAQILKVMLKFGNGRLNVDLWHVRNGRTMRKVIEMKFPKLKNLLPRLSESITGLDPHMQMLLQENPDLELFRATLPKDINKWYGEPYHCTGLELASRRKDLQGFVKVLLDAKANPNQSTKIYDIPVLHQAMANANVDALKVLITYDQVDFGVKNACQHTLLHIAAHKQCVTQDEELEIQKCVNLVLGQKGEEDAQPEDEEADAADAEAANAGPRVDIHAQDESGDTALHDAARYGRQHVVLPLLRSGASVLVRNAAKRTPLHFMDANTLRVFLDEQIRGSGQPRSEDYRITMRYNFLVTQEENVSEIDIIYHISRSYRLRDLLQHPVIRSFLDLKWHLIRWLFYINLTVYVIFILLFTSYVLVINEEYEDINCTVVKPEYEISAPFSNISDDILLSNGRTFTNYLSQNSTHLCLIDVNLRTVRIMISLRILCFCFLAVLLLIEITQFATGPRRYVSDSENLIEILTIVVCACALSCDFNTSSIKQHISAIAILTSWLELALLSGRMPLLSIQLEVLKKVSFTFSRFMVWYSLLVISFVLSFYIIFRNSNGGEDKFFHSPGMAILRTVTMMIGELDASSLTFQVRFTSHLIYLVFVFLVIIILMNVLSGLAVSDTQAIIDDAKVQRLVSLVKLISYFERMVTVTRLCVNTDFRQKYVHPMVQVFSSNTQDKRINLNKRGEVTFLRPYKEIKVQFEDEFTIEQEIVAKAMKILSDKNQATDMDHVMRLLNTLREELGKCQRGEA